MSVEEGIPARTAKQVIVIRRDLKMRRGKEVAQGAHASLMWLSRRLEPYSRDFPSTLMGSFGEAELAWLTGAFTKVTCQVPGEAELLVLLEKAREEGVTAHLVTDAGLTEFHGEATATAVAVGPDWSGRVDAVTGGLELY